MDYKMTPREFFRKLIELYSESREPRYYNPNIFRGRSSSVANQLEDLTALFIALNNPSQCTYYTDQPIEFEGSTTKYPDIVIQDADGTIGNLVDIKTDIGWNREGMYSFCKEWDRRVEAVKGKKTSFAKGKSKTKIVGKFSKRLKYHVVVATLANSGKSIIADYDKISHEFKNVYLYLLSDGTHPNSYGLSQEQIISQIHIRADEFERLLLRLARVQRSALSGKQE